MDKNTDKAKIEAYFAECRKKQNDQFEIIVTDDGSFQCVHKITGQSMQAWDIDHTFKAGVK